MSPVEVIQQALSSKLSDEEGEPINLELLPPLSGEELASFEANLPGPLPNEIKELLALCRGLDGPYEEIDFTGARHSFGWSDVLPNALSIAADGFGNFWLVDLTPSSPEWGPIYFGCHDAPVLLYQAPNLSQFLLDLFEAYRPPHAGRHTTVMEDEKEIWKDNPGALRQTDAVASGDPALKSFASELEPDWYIVDLRNAKPGDGFSWGRFGMDTEQRRFGDLAIFAYRAPEKRGFLSKLFGKSR